MFERVTSLGPAAGLAAAWIVFSSIGSLPVSAQADPFVRGDADGRDGINLTDGVFTLNFLFLGGDGPSCEDAMDSDDSGDLNLSDAISVFNFLFLGGPPPAAPFPDCGADESLDPLTCLFYESCPEPCFRQADLDALLAEEIPPLTCLEPEQTFDIGALEGTICPIDLAPDCGGGIGCPVMLDVVEGRIELLELDSAEVIVHFEGRVADIAIRIDDTVCTNDLTFRGDAFIPVALDPLEDGLFFILSIGVGVFDRDTVAITLESRPDGELVCDIFEAAQELFQEEILDQLEVEANAVLDDVRFELEGQNLCAGDA